MGGKAAPGVKVELADGVKGDIAELTALSAEAGPAELTEIEALKKCIAALFLECEANPYAGELMGPVAIASSPTVDGSASTSRRTKASRASA